jgi:hypothetical protein
MGIKGWVIRVVLGFVLGFGAAFVIEALHLALAICIFGSLDGFLNRKPKREEQIWLLLGLSTMTAGATATFVASCLSVLIAPVHYADRLVLRSWAMAVILAALIGGGLGALVSFLHPRFVSIDGMMALTLTSAVVAGIGTAVFLRVRVNR